MTATVTGITAAYALEVFENTIVSAEIVGSHLILTTQGGDTIDAGDVGSGDYRSRMNLALGLMGTTFTFFNNKADQPVDLMNYADGDLERHTVLYSAGYHNSLPDDDYAPQIVNGEMVIPAPTTPGTGSAGYPLAIINERFNSVAIVGGYIQPTNDEDPATNLGGIAIISGNGVTIDPIDFILAGSVHIGFYPTGIQAGVVHPLGTLAPAGPGLENIDTFNYAYDVPYGELDKVMGYRFVEPDLLYITGPSGQVFKSQSEYYGMYWADDTVAGMIFEIARPYATLDTDAEPRIVGFAMGEPGTPPESLDTTAVHKATAGEVHAMTSKTPVVADEIMIEDSAAAWVKKKITIDAIVTLTKTAIVAGAPGTMDTLDEIAAALADDASFAATITTLLAGKEPTLSTSTTSTEGKIRTATDAEAVAATVTNRAVTPGNLGAYTAAINLYYGGVFQGLHANLGAISALTLANNKLMYANGVGSFALTDFTAFGRSVVDDADSLAARATLGIPETGMSVAPTGAIAETFPRMLVAAAVSALVSGQHRLVAIPVKKDQIITSITFLSGTTAAVAPTNWWFSLVDTGLGILRLTADQTSTAWGTNTFKTVALTTPYTVTATGYLYVGIMMAAGTPINLQVYTSNTTVTGAAPILVGSSTTGMTTPPALPASAGALTPLTNVPYAYVS